MSAGHSYSEPHTWELSPALWSSLGDPLESYYFGQDSQGEERLLEGPAKHVRGLHLALLQLI